MAIPDSGLSPQYRTYERQKCFIGYSRGARWRADIESVCQEVLQGEFNLEPWYADEHPDPTRILRDKVVEMIANTRYGIYDLSYWRKDDKSDWVMPRNVFIELGMAIALNRPTLLLRHTENEEAGLKLPSCLESVSDHILEFSGKTTLREALRKRLPRWIDVPPEQDWWNRYCVFGRRICEYREAYPRARQWGQETLRCHVSDGQDKDRTDFRSVVEEVLGRYSDLVFEYLDNLSMTKGYDFLFCSHCQAVRSTPFAIYRITSKTPAETFIAIGMSIALEKQFQHEIPKILLTASVHDIPSLLYGYEVVEAQNDTERKARLQKFMPVVVQKIRKTTWKPRPLPFIEVVPKHVEKPAAAEDKPGLDAQSEVVEASISPEQGEDTKQLRLDVAQLTDVGRKREHNEDNMAYVIPKDPQEMTKKGALFIVADGVGGHAAGEIASEIAVDTISHAYYQDGTDEITGTLVQAIKSANAAIHQRAAENMLRSGMGTTCVAAVLRGNMAYIANVGDSRAYLVRAGNAKQVSQDHSWVAEQVRAGLLSEDQARTHAQRNVITRCLGTQSDVEIDLFAEILEEGDSLVLCTDGLSDLISDDDLRRIVSQFVPQESVYHLVERANENGGPDNITAIVIHVQEVGAAVPNSRRSVHVGGRETSQDARTG